MEVDIRNEDNMKKIITLLVLFLLIFTSTAGCIDIYFIRDNLVPKDDDKVEYEDIEYVVASHNFTSQILPPDPNKFIGHYEENFTIVVPEGTEAIKFDIDVIMRSAKDIWSDVNDTINRSVIDQLTPYVEMILLFFGQRYLEITLRKPDGTEWYHNTTREGMDVDFRIPSPQDGNWQLDIVGDGMGIEPALIQGFELEDSFIIKVLIKQPKEGR
jgi:hypothetical protein